MTKIILERAIAVDDHWVAALVRQTIHQHATAHFISVTADKRPVALLIRRGDQLTAVTSTGQPMAADEVERLCPGAATRFLSVRPPGPNEEI